MLKPLRKLYKPRANERKFTVLSLFHTGFHFSSGHSSSFWNHLQAMKIQHLRFVATVGRIGLVNSASQWNDATVSLIDLSHDSCHLCTCSGIDGIKPMPCRVSGENKCDKVGQWVIMVEFVYPLKTRQRFNSLSKHTVWVSTRFTSLLFPARTSTVATSYKEATMNTSTGIIAFIVFK